MLDVPLEKPIEQSQGVFVARFEFRQALYPPGAVVEEVVVVRVYGNLKQLLLLYLVLLLVQTIDVLG